MTKTVNVESTFSLAFEYSIEGNRESADEVRTIILLLFELLIVSQVL